MNLDQTPINQLITDNIDVWTSTVKTKSASGRGSSKKLELYGVKKLRELILELAVRGKLVPQDPNDEPASVLLERIAAEKAQLVKEKKIKKPKALPVIEDCEKPFELPQGWEWVKIGQICNVQAGFAFKSKDFNEVGFGMPLIRIRDVGQEFSGTFFSGDYRSEFVVERGDYLISMDGNFRVAPWLGGPALLNQRVSRLQFFRGELEESYIAASLQFKLTKLQGVKAYTTVDHLSGGQISNSVIALPPLAEQHRIVAKVDELMALCDQLEQQTDASLDAHQVLVETLLATLTNSQDATELMANWARISEHFDTLFTTEESIEQLKQTILQLAVMGKLVNIGEKKETLLKSVLTFGPRNGFSPKESSTETHLKVLKLGATSYGVLDLKQSKFIDVDISDKPHLYLNRGDILIQRGNSANFVGSNVLIQESYSDYIYPDLMMKLRVNDEVLPEYVSLLLSSKFSREHMWSQMTGTSGTMPKISKKVVEGVPIIFPVCLEVQKIILEKYNELIDVCEFLMVGLNSLECTKVNLTDAIVEQAV